jgi:hypothetical protein
MIAWGKHPLDERLVVYIALRRGEGAQRWVPVAGRSRSDDRMTAARLCADDAAASMQEIAYRARRLRVISEHSGVAGARVDADMLRRESRALEERIRAEGENLDRLLDPPDRASVICDGQVRLRIGADGVLEPLPDEPEPAASWRAFELGISAAERFGMLLEAMVRVAEQSMGEGLSQDSIDDAIARLRDLHIPDEPYEPVEPGEEVSP